MIDTITIKLSESDFKINDYTKFSPDTYSFFNPPYAKMGSRGYIDAYQNPTRTEFKQGIYKPQLTLRKRWQNSQPSILLYIQFSAPKLLYKNNFDEITTADLDKVTSNLGSILQDMGVGLRIRDLKEAKVTKIHYSKNIILPEYIIPSMVIGEIRKVDYNLHQELTEKDYRNAGHSIRFHTNKYELIIYDKKKDLQKSMQSDKRSIENDNMIQQDLFYSLKKKKHLEILRIEARLNNSNWIKNQTGISKINQTLMTLFDSELSAKVLRKSWKSILDRYQLVKPDIDNKERFLARFIANNPGVKLTNALAAYGYLECVKDMGVTKLRNLAENRFSNRTWYSLKKTMSGYNLTGKLPNQFESITSTLNDYEPLHLKDYEDYL